MFKLPVPGSFPDSLLVLSNQSNRIMDGTFTQLPSPLRKHPLPPDAVNQRCFVLLRCETRYSVAWASRVVQLAQDELPFHILF